MKIKKIFMLIFALITSISWILAQNIIQPNYALKSHETFQIYKIEITSIKTVIYLSIENRIEGGTFCADKNIFIIYPNGIRSRLTSSNGIPVCPDTYKFKNIGEKLDFTLSFPPLKVGIKWVDLIEDCNDNCFSFYGITLDNDLNKKINDAFVLAENEEPAKALVSFIIIAEEINKKNLGVEGLLYINIIKLAKETENTAKASEWYNRMISSGAPRLSQYIRYLNDQGIKY